MSNDGRRRRQEEIYRRSPTGRLERCCGSCRTWLPAADYPRVRHGAHPQAICRPCYRERERRRMAEKRRASAMSQLAAEVVDVVT